MQTTSALHTLTRQMYSDYWRVAVASIGAYTLCAPVPHRNGSDLFSTHLNIMPVKLGNCVCIFKYTRRTYRTVMCVVCWCDCALWRNLNLNTHTLQITIEYICRLWLVFSLQLPLFIVLLYKVMIVRINIDVACRRIFFSFISIV